MSELIAIPFWLLVGLAILSAIAMVDRIFAPGVRWFFRRRVNEAIDELNARLDMRIQPFKVTRRQSLVDQLMYDPQVVAAVDAEAKKSGTPRAVEMARAQRYAREIVPQFSAYAYFGIGTRMARWLSQFVYRVRLGYSHDEDLKAINPEASVVFVMNHRSNMDYVLVTYMASTRASLSYAVGEWARIWLLQSLIRAMGAYFIRRGSGNDLYRRVLSRYVRMATRQGVTQAVFPEGGLSHDGRLRQPRLGLISYMVSDFDPKTDRDVVFVPVGVNYDRVIEDRVLTSRREHEATGRDFRTRPSTIAGFIGRLISLRLRGHLYRYGYACVSFGEPLSLARYMDDRNLDFREMADENRFAEIEKLGGDILDRIGAVIPVLPVALVASVFLDAADEPIGELELKSQVFDLIAALEKTGAYIHVPRGDRDYALSTGLRMLTLRHIVTRDGETGLYRANANETVLLEYYANSIEHLLARKAVTRTKAKAVRRKS